MGSTILEGLTLSDENLNKNSDYNTTNENIDENGINKETKEPK